MRLDVRQVPRKIETTVSGLRLESQFFEVVITGADLKTVYILQRQMNWTSNNSEINSKRVLRRIF